MIAQLDVASWRNRCASPLWCFTARATVSRRCEEGRDIARLIRGASFIELPGNNHVLLAGTPAFDQFIEEATDFVAMHAR